MRVQFIPVVILIATLSVATPAYAGPAEPGAFTEYAGIVAADTFANIADTSQAVGDNITCDPQPVVEGHMINPRVGIVVGELYGQAEIVAHLKCVSLDPIATYTLSGTITDWYYTPGGYTPGTSGSDSMTSVAGIAVINPFAIPTYPGGDPGLNTWHFARFEGTTSTGRRIVGDSQLFYVAGV